MEGDASSAGPYLLTKVLGEGSYSHVKLGTHQETGQQVAVKIVRRKDLVQGRDKLRKTEREVAALQLMSHPNVLQLHDILQTPEHLFLVLEYAPGGDLRPYVDTERLPLQTAFRYLYGILAAIEYCHACCICHRNLKAENILLDGAGEVKVADFGMACLTNHDATLHTSCGSPHYASPEVIQGVAYDGTKSDLWSCGVLCYGLTSGHLPFDDDNMHHLLQKVCAGAYDVPKDCSIELASFIASLLNVKPERRATIADLKKHAWWLQMCAECELDSSGQSCNAVITLATKETFHTPLAAMDIGPPQSEPISIPSPRDPDLTTNGSFVVSPRKPHGSPFSQPSIIEADALPITVHEVTHDEATSSTFRCIPVTSCDADSPLGSDPEVKGTGQEETFSDAVAKIMRDALHGLDDVCEPEELRGRLRKLIHEVKNVQAYADNLHQQLVASSEAKKTFGRPRSAPVTPKRVAWLTDSQKDVAEGIPPEIMAVFVQWGWTEEEARSRILSPEHTLEKAVYHLLQNYMKDGGSVPAPDRRLLVSRNESAHSLLQQLVTLQSSHVRNNKNRSEPILMKSSIAPASWPPALQFSESPLSPKATTEEGKKRGFRWARLFRWRTANVRKLAIADSKSKDRRNDKEKDKEKDKGKDRADSCFSPSGRPKGFLQ